MNVCLQQNQQQCRNSGIAGRTCKSFVWVSLNFCHVSLPCYRPISSPNPPMQPELYHHLPSYMHVVRLSVGCFVSFVWLGLVSAALPSPCLLSHSASGRPIDRPIALHSRSFFRGVHAAIIIFKLYLLTSSRQNKQIIEHYQVAEMCRKICKYRIIWGARLHCSCTLGWWHCSPNEPTP